MSQELWRGDREGVVKGLERLSTEMGEKMAEIVREHGGMKGAAKSQ